MHSIRISLGPMLVIGLLLTACATPAAAPTFSPASVAPGGSAEVSLIKSPTCTCCTGHEAYLRERGLTVRTSTVDDINGVKDAHRIPDEMRSCHTSGVGGYFLEGHVPYEAIEKLVTEQPDLDGIALPGMPSGSPGMGGVLEGPLTVYGIRDGAVVGVFGEF